jgi:hypothetical protein
VSGEAYASRIASRLASAWVEWGALPATYSRSTTFSPLDL